MFVNSNQNFQIDIVGLPFSNFTFLSNFNFRPVVCWFFFFPRPRPGVVLVSFGKRNCACRYLRYCWLVGLVGGCDLGVFGDVGTYLP